MVTESTSQIPSDAARVLRTYSPMSGDELASYHAHDDAMVASRMTLAKQAFPHWSHQPVDARCNCLRRLAQQLRGHVSDLARLVTSEMGKPIVESEAEIEKCAVACDFYATHAAAMLAPQSVVTDACHSYVRCDPLGPILAIMPWNFPFWQVFRFAAPTLAAGNVALLKHASNVTGCSLAIEQLFRDAGCGEGVFQSLLVSSDRVAAIVRDEAIRAITLTGSEQAGRAVATVAGDVLKKCVLELGGSDPFIVLADANVAHAATMAARARTINSGQSCIAAKRFIVEAPVAAAFVEHLTQAMSSLRCGDPFDRATQVGPLARRDLRDELHDQVERSRRAGAHVVCGGTIPAGPGAYYPPTVIDRVQEDHAVSHEETFGPVAAVLRAADRREALAIANRSRFGLGASIWTHDTAAAEECAGELESGCVFVNAIVKSDPRLPFGGIKASGYGRELADVGLREFVNIKSIWVDRDA